VTEPTTGSAKLAQADEGWALSLLMPLFQRKRTNPRVVLYALYLYFLGLRIIIAIGWNLKVLNRLRYMRSLGWR
jgi:hypothetical protein